MHDNIEYIANSKPKSNFDGNKINYLVNEGIISFSDLGLIQYILFNFTSHDEQVFNIDGQYITKNVLLDELHEAIGEFKNNSKSFLKKKISRLERKEVILSKSHPIDKRNKIFYFNPELFGIITAPKKVKNNNKVIHYKRSSFLEKDLELLLIQDLNIIENGMTLIKNQYEVRNGFIDILARDCHGKLCIIELKISKTDTKIIEQSVYYPTQFEEEVRMITIAPSYGKKITQSLKSLGYVEMKTYTYENEKVTMHNYN